MRSRNVTPTLCMPPAVACEADVLEALVDGVDRGILQLVDGLQVFFAADVRAIELLAVEHRHEGALELHVRAPRGRRRDPRS